MKFKAGDQVIITGGKDKGKKGTVIRVYPATDRVLVEGVNMYAKHIKPIAGRAGDKVVAERPLPTAKVAIINDKGQPDRIGYQVDKKGTKTSIFRKTGTVIPEKKQEKAAKKK